MTPAKPKLKTCEKCRGSHYVLTNADGHVRGELCSCFDCAECGGRGQIFIEDENGISSMHECSCAGLRHRLKKVGEAGIPGKFSATHLGTYHGLNASQKLALRIAMDYVKDFGNAGYGLSPYGESGYGGSAKGLLFMGRPGLGKTHLAVSVIKALILEKGADCKFVDFFQLLSDIRYGYSQDLSEQAIINPFVAAPILVIDELAKGRNTEWELTMLDQIISSRYNAADKITLITTNYSDQSADTKSSGKALYTEESLQEKVGERIYSRLVEMCRFIKLEGIDYRQEMQGKTTAPANRRR